MEAKSDIGPKTRAACAMIVATAMLTACATTGDSVQVTSQASGSSYFSLGRPAVRSVQGGLELSGRVCRRARSTLLSPSRVRLEHVVASGDILEVAHAFVAAIHRREDQACSGYATRVAWKIADGDSLRACFDRGRACPTDPATKAVTLVPAVPVAPTANR